MSPLEGEVPSRAYLCLKSLKDLNVLAHERGHQISARVKDDYVDKLRACWTPSTVDNSILIYVLDMNGVAHPCSVSTGDTVDVRKYVAPSSEGIMASSSEGIMASSIEGDVTTEGFELTVQLHTGKTITLKVKTTDTIDNVKAQIQEKEAIPADKQQLTYAGKTMKNNKLLAFYGIATDATIRLTLEL